MIIGLTGFIGAGKGAVASVLISEFEFRALSLSAQIRSEAVRHGIEPTTANLQKYAEQMSVTQGAEYWVKRLLQKASLSANGNFVIDGITSPAEVFALRKAEGFVLVAVDTPLEVRADRVFARKLPSDPKTMERFVKTDEAQKGTFGEKNGMSISKCIILADFVISNAATKEVLEQRVVDLLLKIDKRQFSQNADPSRYD